MIEFGKTLRAAREAKGLAPGDIAQRTHMMIQTVEGLENEDFSRIVAPIYGRGFVKLYCEVVELEPKPMVDAFMELYNGRRDRSEPPASATTPPPPPPPPAPEQSPAPVASEPPPKPAELDFGFAAQEPAPHKIAPSAPRQPPAATKPEQSLSRYAGNLPPEIEPRFKMPAFNINWRLVTLVAAAFIVILVVTLAVRAVYRATMTAPEEPTEATSEETVQEPEPAVEPEEKPADTKEEAAPALKTPRKPLPLKPFYIDSDHSTETQTERNK